MIVASAATGGGFLLHRAAEIERQALRTQQLGSGAFQLKDLLDRSEASASVTPALAAERVAVMNSTADAYRRIRLNDPAEGARLDPSYKAFVRSAATAFSRMSAGSRPLSTDEQRGFERRLSRLEARVDVEMQRLAHDSRVTNPKARFTLIFALVAAFVLVGLLIWEYELQRKAGRIDRDNVERSQELIRLRDEFVASVSHELRTPLTSILGYLELVREMEGRPQATDEAAYLEIIERNAERLLRLVSDLLLVAELEGGRLALHPADIDLGLIAAECIDALRPAAEGKQISLVLKDESVAMLTGDPIRLAQMMDNVVSNAIKFTPEGGRVDVQTSTNDGEAVFEVSDTGPGIAPADQAHLFDPFFRTQSAQLAGVKGTGLGLAITKAIVEAHHGAITVESDSGSGTVFRVRLPQHQPAPVGSVAAIEVGQAG